VTAALSPPLIPVSSAAAYPKNKWLIAIAVTFGTLMGAIDMSIVNVALPHLRGSLTATVEEITWVSTGYIVASVIVMPLTAWLGSRYGRKRIYMAGLTVFLVGSFFCGTARTLPVLVFFRILQGLGAGSLQPTEQAILRETFPPQEQGMAMGLYGVAVMLGPAVGPTLGGFIVDNYSWPWIFYINIPVGLVGLALVWRVVQDPPYLERSKGKIDWLGLALLVIGLGALQTLLEQGERDDWFNSKLNVAYAFVAIACVATFIAHELTTDEPVVNLRVMNNRSFAAATLVGAALGAVLFSTMFLLPVFLQDFLHYDATQTGLALMPRSLMLLVTMPLVGALYNRVSPRLFIIGGLFLGGITAILMSRFDLETTHAQILLPQLLQGVAMAVIFIPLSTVALSTIDRRLMSAATGLNNLVRQLGGSFGTAIFASLLGRFANQARVSLVAHVAPGDPFVHARLTAMQSAFAAKGADTATAHQQALRLLDMQVSSQASMLGFGKTFFWGAILFFASIPLVLLMDDGKRSRGKSSSDGGHEPVAVEV
jgi:MFS transporter, DHA2 family, multidrug resistance protein